MAFLRRRQPDTALTSKVGDNKPHRVSQEAVAKWSQSFDNLLFDKVGLEMFRDFLRSEFSDENLEFWIACEEYKNLKAAKIPEQAQKMYTDFVAVQAPREINLDSKTRIACREKLRTPNKHSFEDAQKRIQALMERDSYPRFLQSEPYLELCTDLKLNT